MAKYSIRVDNKDAAVAKRGLSKTKRYRNKELGSISSPTSLLRKTRKFLIRKPRGTRRIIINTSYKKES